jgi:hypothetical protein
MIIWGLVIVSATPLNHSRDSICLGTLLLCAVLAFYKEILSLLFQNDHIPACNSKYPFLLHCCDDYCAEALRGHGGLDYVSVLPSCPVKNTKVVVYQNCSFASFFCC